MSNIEENNKNLGENLEMKLEEKTQTDIAGNDVNSLILARLDAMENRFVELSKPVPKKKREPSEKQKQALEQARIKKMENFAIRKQMKEDKKKADKEKSKIEVEEYKKEIEKKPEPIVNDEPPVEKPTSPIPTPTEPINIPKSNRKSAPPLNPQSVSCDTYANEPDRKSVGRGMSGRQRMASLFGD